MRGRAWIGDGPKRKFSLGMLAKGSGRTTVAEVVAIVVVVVGGLDCFGEGGVQERR